MVEARRDRPIDVLAAGELLIDFMSTDFADSLFAVSQFEKCQGGSPANLSLNLARLGNRAQLVAAIGPDAMGDFLHQSVAETGLDISTLYRATVPTTLILVTRSQEVSAFEAYRSADSELLPEHLPDDLLARSTLFHTTCFALSRKPAQTTLLAAAARAVAQGCQLSIDLNYAAQIWPNTPQARTIVADYCSQNALVKISEVDWQRLYATPLGDPAQAADHFLKLGAALVCVTLGSEGCYVATAAEGHHLPARPVEVTDTTGAGDAFWAGFLTAYLDGHAPLDCAKAGRSMAEIKLAHRGVLPTQIDRQKIYTG